MYKSYNHEGGVSTPLIAHWPKGIQAKNEFRDQPGHLIDIMATCVDLAGVEYPESFNGHEIQPMEGQSLAPTFDNNINKDRLLMWEHYGNRAIRLGKWKLVALRSNTSRLDYTVGWELYDMENDRTEMKDLSKEFPDKVKALQDLWYQHAWYTRIYPKPIKK